MNQKLYRTVYLIRRTEELIQEHYCEDQMKTPMHMSMGEEAIVAGVCMALGEHDQVLGTYRSHALYLAKTFETKRFFAEMYGKAGGTSRGKAGSMHLMAPEHGLICTSAIVASGIPVAVGAAFANKMHDNDHKVAVFFGDGAIDEGAFWESMNIACLMKLKIVFVCEDNGFAVHTPKQSTRGYDSIAEIIRRFRIDVYESDSTDPEEIFRISSQALNTMDKTGMPVFMNLKYYRYLEHVGIYEDFQAGYRHRSEYKKWRSKDPVEIQRTKLVKIAGEKHVAALEEEIDRSILNDIQLAMEMPFPEDKEVLEGLFS